ncbi:homing endonuclease [Escherichia phage UPEC03]|uniref:HNH endonuclease n=1 Tax=Flagellimonas marina TaxID=1775168 RepID=A0ABV8PS23_9FLAO|nr:homing endonuclease [Escherichia phage UPEC03]URP86142.1 putative homing endonuclease [Enterobacter phage EC-F1]
MSHNGLRTIEEEQKGIDEFLKTVSVDIQTGTIIRTSHKRSDLIGKEVGSKIKGGYTRVYFKSKGYLRHRIIYYVATGKLPDVIDHKNGVEAGDGIDNLREADQSRNCQNRTKRRVATSRFKGVCVRDQPTGIRYIAQIKIDGKVKHIGSYRDEYEAAKAYDREAIKHFGKFAKLNIAY